MKIRDLMDVLVTDVRVKKSYVELYYGSALKVPEILYDEEISMINIDYKYEYCIIIALR